MSDNPNQTSMQRRLMPADPAQIQEAVDRFMRAAEERRRLMAGRLPLLPSP